MPNCFCNTAAIGAKQLVVQEAAEITVSLPSKMLWFTLNTTVFTSLPPGAEITTLRAPARTCASAFSLLVKKPVHSKTTSIPKSFQGNSSGLALANTLISLPLTIIALSFNSTVPLKRPCVLSYLNKCTNISAGVKSLTATTSMPSVFTI